jgi:hypothetical protein
MDPLKPHTEQIVQAEIESRRSLNVSPEPVQRIAITDQNALLDIDPRRILTGEVEVFDNREPRRPR